MAAYFFDSSALVKRYVAERGSAEVTRLVDPRGGNESCICEVAIVEVMAAMARRGRRGEIETETLNAAIGEFRAEVNSIFYVVSVNRRLIDRAAELAESLALRAYDAIQLASALEVQEVGFAAGINVTLVSSDQELNDAAARMGIVVIDPNTA